MQPLVGAWSDRTNTRWGKRKPFIFCGLIIVLISLFLFSNSDLIGVGLGDRMFAYFVFAPKNIFSDTMRRAKFFGHFEWYEIVLHSVSSFTVQVIVPFLWHLLLFLLYFWISLSTLFRGQYEPI